MTNVATLGSFGDASNAPLVFRNKIINGDMTAYQRNAAATAIDTYSLDRWKFRKVNGATESVAQNSDAPSGMGFTYSLRNTISVGDASIASTEYSEIVQSIEGYNIRDLNFGSSFAKPVTIQFWVKATVTGQYAGNIANSDSSRICPFNYTINASNTWEYKTVTLPGCTDGTWNTTGGVGLHFRIYAALGSAYFGGTSGVWNSSTQYGSGSCVNGIASNGNIIAITGVQLEVGLAPTPFEFLPITSLETFCKRYYVAFLGSSTRTVVFGTGVAESATRGSLVIPLPCAMRTEPTFAFYSGFALYGTTGANTTGNYSSISINDQRASSTSGCVYMSYTGGYTGGTFVAYSSASSGVKCDFSAEL